MIDFTEVTIAVIQLVFALLLAYIGKLNHNRDKNANLMELITITVGAAEQLYKTGVVSDRKAYVLQKLAESGVDINAPKVDLAIENEVNKLKAITDSLPKETIDGSGIGYGV